MLPNFLFLGPDKTGSTWLHSVLSAHPRAYVPPAKDIYYFDRFYHFGEEWYDKYFPVDPDECDAVGEICHDYLFSVEATGRIAGDVPGATLLTCLRHPVERAYSQYLYSWRGGEAPGSFEEAIERDPKYLANSRCSEHVRRYQSICGADRVKVLLFDDLRESSERFAQTTFEHLGLEWLPNLPYNERVLGASRARSRAMARLMKIGANTARLLGAPNLVGRVKHSRLAAWNRAPLDKATTPPLLPETRARLCEDFRDETQAVEELTGRRLEAWCV